MATVFWDEEKPSTFPYFGIFNVLMEWISKTITQRCSCISGVSVNTLLLQ